MINPIPERTINYRVYDDFGALLGVATVDLPDIEAMSDTISGAGIAGEVETPTLGHFGSMTATINWRTITPDAMRLAAQRMHALELRSAQQVTDAGAGEVLSQAVRVVLRGTPKNTSLGSLEVGAATDSSTELEVSYLKIYIANSPVLEIDKFNFVYVVDGVDYLAQVRRDLGMR